MRAGGKVDADMLRAWCMALAASGLEHEDRLATRFATTEMPPMTAFALLSGNCDGTSVASAQAQSPTAPLDGPMVPGIMPYAPLRAPGMTLRYGRR